MPYLIIPSRRTRQPQGFVRVNWSNQLTRGLRALWLPNFGGGGVREAVNGLFFPSSGSVSVTAGEYGVGLSLTAGSNYIDCGALASQVVTTQELSVMAIIRPAVLTRGDLITRWVQGASYGDQFNLLYGLSSGKPQFYVSNGGSIANSGASSIALTVGKTSVVGGTASMIESATRVYVDGQLGSSGGVPANISTTSATSYRIGDNIGGDGNYNGDFFGGAVWDRALPLAEWVELYRNPHQLFTPDPRRLYFDGGASGGGGDTSLISSDSTQTQTTDAAILVTSSFLVVQEATQNHSSENVVLDASVSTNLIVADATQTHTSENSVLQVSINLVIDDSIQSQTSDNIALTSVHSLIIQECIQDQTSENIALDSGLILTVADCIQGQTAENITILASSLLLINDATQDQTAENLSFTLATNISVNDSVHSISSESPNLTIPGSGTGATVEEIVDGIMTALLAETIPVNIKKINDVLVYGIGTDGNPWRESA